MPAMLAAQGARICRPAFSMIGIEVNGCPSPAGSGAVGSSDVLMTVSLLHHAAYDPRWLDPSLCPPDP
jgi:hypothetical protein